MPAPAPGASNITFAKPSIPRLNLNTSPGGPLVPQQFNPQQFKAPAPFAEPPPPPPQLNIQQPLPDARIADLPNYLTKQKPYSPPNSGQALPDLSTLKARTPPQPTPTQVTPPSTAPVVGGGGVAVGSSGVISGVAAPLALGLIAGGIWLWNLHQLQKLWALSQPESKPNDLVLEENQGQIPNVKYLISYTVYVANPPAGSGYENTSKLSLVVWGEYKGYRFAENIDGLGTRELQFLCRGIVGFTYNPYIGTVSPSSDLIWVFANSSSSQNQIHTVTINNIQQLDENNQPIPNSIQQLQTQPQPQKQPQLLQQPITNPVPQFAELPPKPKLNIIPNLKPPKPINNLEENKVKPFNIEVPANKPITISSPTTSPISIAPNSQPQTINLPQLQRQPEPQQDSRPFAEPTVPRTINLKSPNLQPIKIVAPSNTPVTINIPGFEPITVDANKNKPNTGVTPNAFNPTSLKPTPLTTTPLTPQPQPNKQPTTQPVTQPTPQPQPTPSPFPNITQPDLTTVGLQLVAITQLLQGIQKNTTPSSIATAAANGTCQTTEPGGCISNSINNAVGRGNQNMQDWLRNNLGDLANAGLGTDTNLRVRNLEDKVGAYEYPMILPEYLLDDYLDKQVTINNQVQYNGWLLKQIDALVGLFPIKIERVNEDGQKEMLKFENIAESIAELTGLLAQIAFDADTAVNVATRSTAEAIGAKAAALQAGSYLKAIVDYLGFEGQAVSVDVPISVTPGAVGLDGKLQENELKDFLKPSVQKTIGYKNTDPVDQRLVLRRILEDGEIARAALFRPLKPDLDNQNRITGDAIKESNASDKKRLDEIWETFKRRYEGHTSGTKVDIDDGDKTSETT